MENDGYTFALSDDVTRIPVRSPNRYGIEIAGDLYRPRSQNATTQQGALVIGPPHGGVKEQGAGLYAQEMARRGFVALAFDPSYNGESGGAPRHVTSPEIFAEDFSAGVDYLGTLAEVDRNRIGAIGICGSGGFALSRRRSIRASRPSRPVRCMISAGCCATAGRMAAAIRTAAAS